MKKKILKIAAIILMAISTTVKRVLAILKMKNLGKIGDFMDKAKFIRQSMLGNAFFPAPPVSVANGGQFDTDITALDKAQTTALTRAVGAVAARNVAKKVVLNDMHLLLGYVQSIADANPVKAQQIVQSSGFDMKIVTPHSKDEFSAKNTAVSGTVKLAVNVKKVTGGNKRASFKWQISTDNITWKDLPASLKGTTLVSGLTAGTTYYFRYLVVLKDGESSWSQPVSLLVI